MMKQRIRWASALLSVLLLASLSFPAALAADVFREAKEDVNLRAGAGTQFSIITTVPKGDVVVVTSMWYAEWWKVTYTNADGKSYTGYIKSEYLKETSKRKNEKKNTAALGCYKATLELNLRAGPGRDYESLTAVPKGNVVNVTDTTSKEWYKCTFINAKGKKYTGWLSAKYVKKAAEPYNVKSKTQLRKTASTSAKNLQTLPKGSYLFVTAVYSSKWFKVEYTGIDGDTLTGYVLRSKVKKGTVTNKPYKQVDPDAEAKKLAEQWRTKKRYQLTAKTKLTKTASKKGKKVATLAKGTVVAVTGTSGKFYKVIWNNEDKEKDGQYEKKTGYLPKSKLKKYTDPEAGDYVARVPTQIRSTDSQTGQVLLPLTKGTVFTVTDSSETDWYLASCTDEEGNAVIGFVDKSHAEKYVEKNAGNYCTRVPTELRKTASDTGEVLSELPQGSLVKVKKTVNADWYYATYKNEEGKSFKGYVESGHIRKFRTDKRKFEAIVLTPVRNQPSQVAQPIAEMPEGQILTVNDTPVEDWYWASFKDEDGTKFTGFVYAPYVKEYEEPKEEPAAEEPAQEQPTDPLTAQQEQTEEPNEQPADEPAAEEQPAEESAGADTPAEEPSGEENPEESAAEAASQGDESRQEAEQPQSEETPSEGGEERSELWGDAA